MLRLTDIHKSYHVGPTTVDVLRGISFTVEKGELLSIIGPSGSGKSTLMNILGLLEQPSSGTYSVEDTKITYDDDRTLSSLRNKMIGFVFQQYNLLPRLTAIDNVGLPLIYRGMSEKEITERSMEYIKKVEMEERSRHKPTELSGGQQQRIAIARALAGSPSLILADEPTGALDTHTGQEIMNLFKRLNEEEGITIVVITHDPKIAAQCRRKVELRDGIITG
ncbi:MAG TPA: ABC transporter ATP-binding protein [Syntrophorhabdaceae bacterium]|nr:ABC transporter ATP-binding protein [Syntrophorhabdaceae bacterium]HQM79994.1 ABC transporter ATP-binding protein [Syntrophorhabdaceae bacterium]